MSLFGVDTKLFLLLEMGISDSIKKSYVLRKRDKLATTLVLLKLNPSHEAVGALFCVDPTTIASWFDEIIHALSQISKNGILWWPKDQIQARMPKQCKKIDPNIRCYADCSEVPIEIPADQLGAVTSYSSYKTKNTIKVSTSYQAYFVLLNFVFANCGQQE